jgi:hypothetical protein
MRPFQHGAVPARNGALFVLVGRMKIKEPCDLELWRSDDGGETWRCAASTSTEDDVDGTLVVDGDGIACAWTANDNRDWSAVYWQRYDVQQDRWIGEPTPLIKEDNHYTCYDMARTNSGAIVVAIGSHRSPPKPTWRTGWSTGMRWLRPGDEQWQPLVQVNVAIYAVCTNLISRGDLVDFTYRTNPRAAVHGVRTFDCAKGVFAQDAEERAMVEPAKGAHVTNMGVLCADDTGGRTLLHVLGDGKPGAGRLVVSFGRPGDEWKTVDLADDPPLCAGNENPAHFALARGPGDQVFAYFSKQSEDFSQLWQCVIESGVPATEPRVVASGVAGEFATLCGMRDSSCHSGLHVVIRGATPEHPGGVVSVYGTWPARTVWTAARTK